MTQIIQKPDLGEEVDEYLSIKGKATRLVYRSSFNLFLKFYQNKHERRYLCEGCYDAKFIDV